MLSCSPTKGHDFGCCVMAFYLVGVAGFEPAASSSRTKRAAKLRYTPPPAPDLGAERTLDSLVHLPVCTVYFRLLAVERATPRARL